MRDFRLYWVGLVSQVIGQHMFAFTLGWLAFEIIGALTLYNASLIAFAFSDWYWFSLCALFIAGLCHAYFLTWVQVMLQTLVEHHYRGRVMSVFELVWSLMFLSGLLFNTAGALVGPRVALVGGASVVLAYVWLSLVRARALPTLVLAPKPGRRACLRLQPALAPCSGRGMG